MIDTAMMYLGAATVSAILNDGDFEKALKNPFKVVYNGKEYSLRSVPADVYHAIHDPESFVMSRLNPAIIIPLIKALLGRDSRGKFQDVRDQLESYVKGAAPIATQGLFKEGDIGLWETAMRSVGMNVYDEVTPFERGLKKEYAKTISIRQDREERKLTEITYNYSEQLRRSFKYDGDEGWNKTLDKIKGEINTKIKAGTLPENIGEKITERLFQDRTAHQIKPMSIKSVMDAWPSATSAEKNYYFPLVYQKLKNFAETHPEQLPATLERFKKVFAEQIKDNTEIIAAMDNDEVGSSDLNEHYVEKSKRRTFGKADTGE
jgi:hypothetical protein